jgi:hypothetical protein
MERRDKRLKEEENRLKAGEDQLRQREEYQRTRQGALREHREERATVIKGSSGRSAD